MPAGFFDSHALFTDIYEHPELYLNGTAPLNVTGAAHACVYELNESTSGHAVCTTANVTDQDSFLWYVILCLWAVVFRGGAVLTLGMRGIGTTSCTRPSRRSGWWRRRLRT